ncbi:MAG: hypothetical protein M1816_006281 [Peltula sp. TS41687]|nr:MAG: hypothetical protein M1816_006281 [Peltula sp. TS41687]
MDANPPYLKTVLITGSSRGMGLSVGRQLAEKGANIIIVARDVDKLREGIALISLVAFLTTTAAAVLNPTYIHTTKAVCPQQGARSPQTQRFHHISANLITPAESARVIAEATAWNGGAPPDIVWNCAGSSYPTLFIDTPLDQFQHMMDSNYFTSVYMAHAALTAWLRPMLSKDKPPASASENTKRSPPPSPRHLIFTSSFVAFYSIAGFAPYSPAKAALRSLSDSLSQEMNLYAAAHPAEPGVRLHTVFPATIFTDSFEAENRVKADVTRMLEESDKGQTADEVARRSIAGLERGEELVVTTLLTRLVMTGMLGGSVRGGWVKGFVDTLLGWLMVVVMVFVRWEMDGKVRRWGREHGASGMKRAQ